MSDAMRQFLQDQTDHDTWLDNILGDDQTDDNDNTIDVSQISEEVVVSIHGGQDNT